MSAQPMRAYTDVERASDQLQAELRRLKSMTTGWKTVDQYITALKFFDETVQPAFDAVRTAIVETHNVD